MNDRAEITRLLQLGADGDAKAVDRLLPLVYDELQGLARRMLANEARRPTLATVDLVHEAYLKLVDQTRVSWQGRGHFLAVAAMAMRRVVVDRARRRKRIKRGGGEAPLPLDENVDAMSDEKADEVVLLDLTLDRLAEFDPRAARIVECRYFAGLSVEETAQALGCSPITVKRSWRAAKSWLRKEMFGETPPA